MSPTLVRAARTFGLVRDSALVVALLVACGEALETPFYGRAEVTTGGAAGMSPGGGTSGTAIGGTGAISGAGLGGTPMAGSGGSELGGSGGTDAGGTNAGGTDTGGSGGAPIDCSLASEGAVGFEGHCYVLRPAAATFGAAREDCSSRGAHLVTISSEGRAREQFLAENAFVWELGGGHEQWIGATDGKASNEPGDGTFYTWITGEPMAEDLWTSGQPNNAFAACGEGAMCSCGDSCYEHCGFQWGETGEWNDRVCEHLLPYVCEWDAPPGALR